MLDGWFARFCRVDTPQAEQANVEAETAGWVEEELQAHHLIEVAAGLMQSRQQASPLGANLEEALAILGKELRKEIGGWKLSE